MISLNKARWPTSCPDLRKGNDRIGLIRLSNLSVHYLLLPLILSKRKFTSVSFASFVARCARELLFMASEPSKIISAHETFNTMQF